MYAKLNPLKLGLAAGIFWGVALFIMTWISIFTGYAMFWLSVWMDVYPGYNFSVGGSFIGLIWGFVDGFVCLFIFGWLYNLFRP
ncbi:MAG: bacteriophage holin [Chlamydiales bacterium]